MDEQRVREIVREELAAAGTTTNSVDVTEVAKKVYELQKQQIKGITIRLPNDDTQQEQAKSE